MNVLVLLGLNSVDGGVTSSRRGSGDDGGGDGGGRSRSSSSSSSAICNPVQLREQGEYSEKLQGFYNERKGQ